MRSKGGTMRLGLGFWGRHLELRVRGLRLRLNQLEERAVDEEGARRIGGRVARGPQKSFSTRTTRQSKEESVFKNGMERGHHDLGLLRLGTMIRLFARRRDRIVVGRDSQSGVGRRADTLSSATKNYQPPPIFPAISITRSVSPALFPTSLTTSR